MQSCQKYKPSGIDWIGEIPSEWQLKKLKYLAKIMNGQDHKNVWDENGKYPIIGTGGEFGKANQYLHTGPSVILGRKGTIDKPQFITEPFWSVDTAYYTNIPSYTNPRFFFYCCKTILFDLYKYGSAVPSMTQETLNQIQFATPPLIEQTDIANFLDEKTTQIDKLISNKQMLIELLKEERAAMIDDAITRGINKNANQKKTDFDWIGTIPNHWEIKKLRFIGKCQNGVSKGREYFGSGFPFATYGDVYNNEMLPMNLSGLAESSDEDRINYSVMEGDVFFTRTSETVEEIGLTSTCLNTIDDATFSGFLIRFRPCENILFKGFSKFYFRSQIHRKYFVKEMNLVTRASLSQGLLKNLPVLIPPLKEQMQIAEYIQTETQRIDNTISKIEKEIELMNEYKTALISEVLTGKIKVI